MGKNKFKTQQIGNIEKFYRAIEDCYPTLTNTGDFEELSEELYDELIKHDEIMILESWKNVVRYHLKDTPWLQEDLDRATTRIEIAKVLKSYINYHESFIDDAKSLLMQNNTF